MQYKCNECNDTGSLDKSGQWLNCVSCEAATDRAALEAFIEKLPAMGEQERAWAIHQRALAMAPKQEAPGKYLNNEEVKQLVAALAMGADNTEALRSEAPRRLVAPLWAQSDCIAAALRIVEDFPAAPAAANGALPELPSFFALGKTRINGVEHGHYSADQMRAYGQACAAAGPDAALTKALEMAVQQNECDMLMTGEECRQCRATLSGAKGN